MRIPLPSRPGDVPEPPGTCGADAATGRPALPAGALGTVGDNGPRDDAQRPAVAGDTNGDYPDDVEHLRQSRLSRWQEQR